MKSILKENAWAAVTGLLVCWLGTFFAAPWNWKLVSVLVSHKQELSEADPLPPYTSALPNPSYSALGASQNDAAPWRFISLVIFACIYFVFRVCLYLNQESCSTSPVQWPAASLSDYILICPSFLKLWRHWTATKACFVPATAWLRPETSSSSSSSGSSSALGRSGTRRCLHSRSWLKSRTSCFSGWTWGKSSQWPSLTKAAFHAMALTIFCIVFKALVVLAFPCLNVPLIIWLYFFMPQ